MKTKYMFAMLISFSSLVTLAQTPRINIKVPKLYPEGVAYHQAKDLFFVSSVKSGTIGTVDALGNYKEFYADKDLISSFGMKVDPQGKNLWVALSDPNPAYSIYSSEKTLKKMGRLIAIDLNSKKKVKDIDLAKLYDGKHFINDIAFDAQGNIYATDSYSPVIYKVDAAGTASVFAENELFKGTDIGLNGIAVNSSGYLITVNNSDGTILKVDLKQPKKVSKVKIDGHFPGADGIMIDGTGNLVLIQNKGVNKVYTISSGDNFMSAKVVSATDGNDRFAQPSTGIMRNGKFWALNSKLNELTNKTMPPSVEFSLQEAVFRPVK